MKVVSATEFKAKCLSLLDEIDRGGGLITITKRGRPVATLGPARKKRWKSSAGILAGKVDIPDEVLFADYSDLYDCVRESEQRQDATAILARYKRRRPLAS